MDAAKKQALEVAGWKVGDAEDFLGTNETGVEQMSESKHTPGPWMQGGVKELLLNNKCREIVADDGKIGLVYGITDADCKANAHLIAAAPDMLQALELALKDMVHWGIFGPGRNAVEAAIKKAKGE